MFCVVVWGLGFGIIVGFAVLLVLVVVVSCLFVVGLLTIDVWF